MTATTEAPAATRAAKPRTKRPSRIPVFLSVIVVAFLWTLPSLGLLISNGFEYMLSGDYWISFFPGLVLLLTIVIINLVGDQLRDVLNPRLSR